MQFDILVLEKKPIEVVAKLGKINVSFISLKNMPVMKIILCVTM